AHVVGALGLFAERRAAQHHLPVRVFDQVRQVRGATWKLADLGAALQAGDLGLQIGVDGGKVQLLAAADIARLIDCCHNCAPMSCSLIPSSGQDSVWVRFNATQGLSPVSSYGL